MHDIEQSGNYNFVHVTLVGELQSPSYPVEPALSRLEDDYNYPAFPSCFFDGGDTILVGGFPDTVSYSSRIRTSGARAVYPLDLRVATRPLGGNDYEVRIRIGNNQPANTPPSLNGPISGPSGGEPDSAYSFSVTAVDSDPDEGIYYQWDWGDGDTSSWAGPMASNVTHQAVHTWVGEQTYQVRVRAKDYFDDTTGWSVPLAVAILNTSVGDPDSDLPTNFHLAQNHPNPFNPSTTIEYFLPRPSEVLLSVHNLLGQTIVVLVDGNQSVGSHIAIWDGTDSEGKAVASGVYLYQLQAGSFIQSHKMVLLK